MKNYGSMPQPVLVVNGANFIAWEKFDFAFLFLETSSF